MQPSDAATRQLNSAASLKILAILIFIAGICPSSARAGGGSQATTTTLSVSSAEVTAGTAVTLTATVTSGRGAVRARGGGILRRQRHTMRRLRDPWRVHR